MTISTRLDSPEEAAGSLAPHEEEPPPYPAGFSRSETRSELRGARLLFGDGLFDLLLNVADAGKGADADLVVGALDALLAFALGPAAAEERTEVAAEEA